MTSESGKAKSENDGWLPDMDLNHDKQIQSLLCYRYTIPQNRLFSLWHAAAESRPTIATELNVPAPG